MRGAKRSNDGQAVEVGGSVGPLIQGTDSEIRGLVANFLLDGGIEFKRIGRIVKAKKSQLYKDLAVVDEKRKSRSSRRLGVYDPAETDEFADEEAESIDELVA